MTRFVRSIRAVAVLLPLNACAADGITGPSAQARPAPTVRPICSTGVRPSGPPPLWVLDGERLTDEQGRARGIQAADVVRIDVIKGPAAIAEYGPAGANGVLLIRTKAGAARQEARPSGSTSSNPRSR